MRLWPYLATMILPLLTAFSCPSRFQSVTRGMRLSSQATGIRPLRTTHSSVCHSFDGKHILRWYHLHTKSTTIDSTLDRRTIVSFNMAGSLLQISKPMSVKEIALKAEDFEFNPFIAMKYWLRTADTLLREVCCPTNGRTL